MLPYSSQLPVFRSNVQVWLVQILLRWVEATYYIAQ